VPLRETARGVLKDQLELLDEVRQRVAAATKQFRGVVRRDPCARRLMTLPGVSTILGYTILAEVGDIKRFSSGRSLSRYSLLAPMADDSGERRRRARLPLAGMWGRWAG
jgi:transposase